MNTKLIVLLFVASVALIAEAAPADDEVPVLNEEEQQDEVPVEDDSEVPSDEDFDEDEENFDETEILNPEDDFPGGPGFELKHECDDHHNCTSYSHCFSSYWIGE